MPRIVSERADVIPELAEIFRENGYSGTSISAITDRTGLGKGSLYHFFPGGKAEMAEAVLSHIDTWFENNIFRNLEVSVTPALAIEVMFDAVETYFRSGKRVCLIGAFALDSSRDTFSEKVSAYFERWTTTLSKALRRAGVSLQESQHLAVEVVGGIQGAIVLSRALNRPKVFSTSIEGLKARCRPN